MHLRIEERAAGTPRSIPAWALSFAICSEAARARAGFCRGVEPVQPSRPGETRPPDPAVGRARFGQSFPNSGEPADAASSIVCQRMKRVSNTSEVLGTVETPEGKCEVDASADAEFDEAAGRLVVKLEAFLRPADFLAKERRFRAKWLPENETVTESVAREECHDVAREIFQRWVRKVRASAPPLHPV